MRLRIPELMKEHGLTTAYALAQLSAGRINMTTAYRLTRQGGKVVMIEMRLLEALCDTFDVKPGDLFERESSSAGTKGRRK
jgi:DNA-binding Xre family transcriptional regulator